MMKRQNRLGLTPNTYKTIDGLLLILAACYLFHNWKHHRQVLWFDVIGRRSFQLLNIESDSWG
jgi:hypothetical protein